MKPSHFFMSKYFRWVDLASGSSLRLRWALGCFHVLPVVSRAATAVVHTHLFPVVRYMPGSGTLAHGVVLCVTCRGPADRAQQLVWHFALVSVGRFEWVEPHARGPGEPGSPGPGTARQTLQQVVRIGLNQLSLSPAFARSQHAFRDTPSRSGVCSVPPPLRGTPGEREPGEGARGGQGSQGAPVDPS